MFRARRLYVNAYTDETALPPQGWILQRTTQEKKHMSKSKKPRATSLNIVRNKPELISIVKKECRSLSYDVKKVMTLLNCSYNQAYILITMAEIEDKKNGSRKEKAA